MENVEAEKIARTESVFREVNEGIAETADRLDATETAFLCECADPTCTDRIEATLDEYEEAREQGTTFMLVPGHEDKRIETVVERNEEHTVVEKRHPATVRVALALNPRAS
jgi:hypothetical protein